MARVAVVGAGVGGLAAAARLAASGHEVTVYEAAEAVGGKAGLIEHRTAEGTFRFDTGPSLLTMPQVFTELFAATGDPLESVLSLRELDPSARYRFEDGTVLSTTRDLDEQSARFDHAFGAGAGAAWAALVGRGARIWEAVEGPVLSSPLTSRSALRGLSRPGDLAAVAPGRTLHQVGKRYLTDPRQRAMLDRYATYAGSDPRRAPAALAVIPFVEHAFGSWYVDGGIYALVRAIARRAVERGAVIRTGARVDRIDAGSGRVEGVMVDGRRERADVVVANADASTVSARLLQPAPRSAPGADSFSGFVLLLGVRGRTPGLAHHNVLFGSAPYADEFDALFGRRARLVTDPVIYVSAPADDAVRPPGHEAWFVLVNAPRHSAAPGRGCLDWDSPGLANAYADRLLSLLAARGLPVRERVMFSQVLTPADLERRTGAPGGSIYGGALHGLRAAVRRPSNTTGVPGLYLVGGSAHPGGGLPMVARSARIVADLIGPS